MSFWDVQTGIYSKLSGDSTVTDLLADADSVYDHVPQDSVFPYITIGEVDSADFSTKDFQGQEHEIKIKVWSRYRGEKEVKQIMEAVYDSLHLQSITMSSNDLILLRFMDAEARLESDGLTRLGEITFRVLVCPS